MWRLMALPPQHRRRLLLPLLLLCCQQRATAVVPSPRCRYAGFAASGQPRASRVPDRGADISAGCGGNLHTGGFSAAFTLRVDDFVRKKRILEIQPRFCASYPCFPTFMATMPVTGEGKISAMLWTSQLNEHWVTINPMAAIAPGQLHRVLIAIDSAGSMEIWIDGARVASENPGGGGLPLGLDWSVHAGAQIGGGNTFEGLLEDLWLFDSVVPWHAAELSGFRHVTPAFALADRQFNGGDGFEGVEISTNTNSVPNPSSPHFGGAFSVALTLRIDTFVAWTRLFDFRSPDRSTRPDPVATLSDDPANPAIAWQLWLSDHSMVTLPSPPGAISMGKFHRILLTVDLEGDMEIWVDGQRVAQGNPSGGQSLTRTSRNLWVGSDVDRIRVLNGRICDFWIFHGVVPWRAAEAPSSSCYAAPDYGSTSTKTTTTKTTTRTTTTVTSTRTTTTVTRTSVTATRTTTTVTRTSVTSTPTTTTVTRTTTSVTRTTTTATTTATTTLTTTRTSSTTTATETTLTSSTTTWTAPPGFMGSAEMVARAEEDLASRALQTLGPVQAEQAGMSLFAFRLLGPLGVAEIYEKLTAVPDAPYPACLRIPAALVAALGSDVLAVATVLGGDQLSRSDDVVVHAAMALSLFRREANGTVTRLHMANLTDAIELTLPGVRAADAACGFWSEPEAAWSGEGLVTLGGGQDGRQLVCTTHHLTVFASIGKGFTETFRCTHVQVLSREGLAELASGDWQGHWAVVAFVVLLCVLLAMLLAACALDHSEARRQWGDAFFLLPDEGSFRSEEASNPSDVTARLSMESAAKSSVKNAWEWCKSSSALRDALDDMGSRWFAYISEVRDLAERLCEGLHVRRVDKEHEEEEEEKRWHRRVSLAAATSITGGLVRRQAAAQLGITARMAQFLTENREVETVLQEAVRKLSQGTSGSQEEHWLHLHGRVVQAIDDRWSKVASEPRRKRLPRAMAQLFVVSNPATSAFLACHFWTSGLRVLFVAIELLGGVVVATLFFEVSGLATSKRNRGSACARLTEPGEQFGRLLAIALASLLVANIPVILLSALHSRTFVKVGPVGSVSRRRQLDLWRVQDALLWALGLTYCGCCATYILAFLANVNPLALSSWSLAGYAVVLQDALVIPLAVASMVPATSALALRALSCLRGQSRRSEALGAQQRLWQGTCGAWFKVVDSI